MIIDVVICGHVHHHMGRKEVVDVLGFPRRDRDMSGMTMVEVGLDE
jgi:hypothetical protein